MTAGTYAHNRTMFRTSPGAYALAVATIPVEVGLVALLGWYVSAKCESLRIEGGRVDYRRGVLGRDHVELYVANVRSVRVDQTLWQRIFGVGDVSITSSGSSPEIVARGMPRANVARRLLSP